MSPAAEKRIRHGVLVGSLALMGVVWGSIAYKYGLFRLSPMAYWGFVFMALVIGWPLGHLAIKVVRRLTVVRLLDTIIATVLLIMVLFSLLLFDRLSDTSRQIVGGDPCGDGKSRRIYDVEASQKPGSAIFWVCVPQDEYEAWASETPAELQRPTVKPVTAERFFERLSKANVLMKSVVGGTIAALAGWLYAFGWRWSVRTDAL